MADFTTPFGNASDKRYPNTNEKSLGFPCGPANQRLFNGLMYRIEAEIGEVISHAGITGSDADFTQLRQAIQALIEAETGAGDVSGFVLMTQAAARLPIHADIQTAGNVASVTSPANGEVRLNSGTNILFRGIKVVTTTEQDFTTVANKTYHLRMLIDGTVTLNDVSDVAYNVSSLVESDSEFDSTFENLLLARITTNSSNVVNITPLVNRPVLNENYLLEGVDGQDLNANGSSYRFTQALNWSRTPKPLMFSIAKAYATGNGADNDVIIYNQGQEPYGTDPSVDVNRYTLDKRMIHDFTTTLWVNFNVEAV